ncbi:hypothetical protein BFJ71_g4275 [Fusarium oxysporum]|nr:hypothetical protein BFJ71_g4275 [Fusarium oxysporum]
MGWNWIVYHKVGFPSSAYMDRCTAIELDWLLGRHGHQQHLRISNPMALVSGI